MFPEVDALALDRLDADRFTVFSTEAWYGSVPKSKFPSALRPTERFSPADALVALTEDRSSAVSCTSRDSSPATDIPSRPARQRANAAIGRLPTTSRGDSTSIIGSITQIQQRSLLNPGSRSVGPWLEQALPVQPRPRRT